MAVNDDRMRDPQSPPRPAEPPRHAAAGEHDGPTERTVGTVLEGVDRVAAKIKGLLGSHQ